VATALPAWAGALAAVAGIALDGWAGAALAGAAGAAVEVAAGSAAVPPGAGTEAESAGAGLAPVAVDTAATGADVEVAGAVVAGSAGCEARATAAGGGVSSTRLSAIQCHQAHAARPTTTSATSRRPDRERRGWSVPASAGSSAAGAGSCSSSCGGLIRASSVVPSSSSPGVEIAGGDGSLGNDGGPIGEVASADGTSASGSA
jgi:hypothetical protein